VAPAHSALTSAHGRLSEWSSQITDERTTNQRDNAKDISSRCLTSVCPHHCRAPVHRPRWAVSTHQPTRCLLTHVPARTVHVQWPADRQHSNQPTIHLIVVSEMTYTVSSGTLNSSIPYLISIIRVTIITTETSCRREAATICPAPVRRTLRPSSSPYTPYAWPAAPSAPCFQ